MSTTTWSPATHSDYDTLIGFDVFTSDHEKLGTIAEVSHPAVEFPSARGSHVFRIDPGLVKKLFTGADELFVPERLVRMVTPEEQAVILEITRSTLVETDWSRPDEFDIVR